MKNLLLLFRTLKNVIFGMSFILIALMPKIAAGQCPNTYVFTQGSGSTPAKITFNFEAGNGVADRDIACDFVRKNGGTGTDPCSGGYIIVNGIRYNYTGNNGGGNSAPIILTYTAATTVTNPPTNYQIAEGIGCGQTSDNGCLSIIFQDRETGQNCTSSNSYFTMILKDNNNCGPYSLVTSGNSVLVFGTASFTTGTYTTQTIKAGIYIFVFKDKNGIEHPFIYNHITQIGTCIRQSNLDIVKSITSYNPCAKAGDLITYSFVVTSDAPIASPYVYDDNIGYINVYTGDTNNDGILQVGEKWTFTATYTITQTDIDRGNVTNYAYARGTDSNGFPIFSDPDDATATLYQYPICLISSTVPADTVGIVYIDPLSTVDFCAPEGMKNYAWTGPFGFTSTQRCITVNDPGTYSVTITNANNCQSTCVLDLGYRQTQGCELVGPITVCPGSTSTYSTTTEINQGFTYNWSLKNNSNSATFTVASDQKSISVTSKTTCNTAYTVLLQIKNPGGRVVQECEVVVSVDDTQAPVFDPAPDAVTVSCIEDVPVMISLAWTDNCDDGGTVLGVDGPLVGGACGGTITRTWNISDACGNPAVTRTQIITVKDEIAPEITCLPNKSTSCPSVPVFDTPVIEDNCDPAPALVFADGDRVPLAYGRYSVTRTWRATDNCGNSSTCSQTITVEPCCNTAYAFRAGSSTCFLDKGFSSWGWTIQINSVGNYTIPLYGGAGGCDISKGQHIGNILVVVTKSGRTFLVTVTYNIFQGYGMNEANLYVGTDMFPLVKKIPTVSPGQYTKYSGALNMAITWSTSVPVSKTPFYLIAHAVVCSVPYVGYQATSTKLLSLSNNPGKLLIDAKATTDMEHGTDQLKVYPNPFTQRLYFDLQWHQTSHAKLEIFDIRGAKLTTLYDNPVEAGQFYRVEYAPEGVAPGMLFYRLVIGSEVINGKVLYQKQ